MNAHHRKIDLQSPSDLTYLLSNIKTAARQKIDLAIPRSAAPQGEDAYRERVEELVQQYIIQTLSLALPSLSINGFDASPSLISPHAASTATSSQPPTTGADLTDAEISAGNYEAYDPRLAERLRGLYAQCEFESETVAKMRREVPAKAAMGYREALERELEAQKGLKGEEGVGGEVDGGLDIKLERREEVEGMWRRGCEGLEGLGDITGVLAKVERAGRAMEVVEGL